MARQQQNSYDSDKEKRDLAKARTAELNSRTNQREDNSYFRSRGFPDRPTMTEAENSSEKRATNSRLTENAAQNSKIEALKALSIAGVGSPHGQAALDELAKIAGVKVPKTVDPKQAAMNKVRAKQGLPPLPGTEETPTSETASSSSQPQQDESLFQPQAYGGDSGLVQQPETPREASLGNPITPHLGIGGAEMTPENPTGDLRNPFGAGGLLDNPTHAAAQNVNAREMAAHPYGSDNGPISQTYFPGEAVDRLAGGSQPRPQTQPQGNRIPPAPVPGSTTLVSNPAATVPVPSTPSFDTNNLVQPQAGPRTPPNVNVDLDALASHIGNWFSSQANQMKKQPNRY